VIVLRVSISESVKVKGIYRMFERWKYRRAFCRGSATLVLSIAIPFHALNSDALGGLILGANQLGTKQSIDADNAVEINLSGFGGRFFGQNLSSIWLAENGYLSQSNVTGSDFFSESLETNTTPRIANFWDDIFVLSDADGAGPQQGIFFSNKPGQYVAATWSQVFLLNDFAAGDPISNQFARSFQTVWFEADTVLSNFQFRRDDIAFGFGGFSTGNIDAIVGIRDSLQYFTIDDAIGRPDGQAQGGVISTTSSEPGFPNAHLLPWEEDKFLLFRSVEDANGNFSHYRVSVESFSAIPEPTSWMLICAGTGVLWWCRRRNARILE